LLQARCRAAQHDPHARLFLSEPNIDATSIMLQFHVHPPLHPTHALSYLIGTYHEIWTLGYM
jgi:hypothetical protein